MEFGSVPLSAYLTLSIILFAVGAFGVFARRNALIVLLSVEIMLNAVNLTFIAFARYRASINSESDVGHVITFFVIAVAAAEAAIGLALEMGVFRHKRAVNVDDMNAMRN